MCLTSWYRHSCRWKSSPREVLVGAAARGYASDNTFVGVGLDAAEYLQLSYQPIQFSGHRLRVVAYQNLFGRF